MACSHGRDSIRCVICAGSSQYEYTYPSRQYTSPGASSIDVNRCEREVSILREEVRRLSVLVEKLISIFSPGEKQA